MLRWLAVVIALIGALVYAVLAFNPAPGTSTVGPIGARELPQGDSLRLNLPAPETLNPFVTSEPIADRFLLGFLHDALLDEDPIDGHLRSALAGMPEEHEGANGFTFQLRPDIVFDDGSPITTADIEFALELATADHDVLTGSYLVKLRKEIESYEIHDARRFTLRQKEPHHAALRVLATALRVYQRAYFVDQVHRLARADGRPPPTDVRSAEFAELLARIEDSGPASGPFTLRDRDGRSQWIKGQQLKLLQNPASWQLKAHPRRWNLGSLVLKHRTLAGTTFPALKNEEIDLATGGTELKVLLEQNPDLGERYRHILYDRARNGYYYVQWNHERPALRRPEVRRALTMLFDRQTMLDTIFGDAGAIAVSHFKPGSPEIPADLEPWPYDPDRARELLASAGYTAANPLPLTLSYVDFGVNRRIVEIATDAFLEAPIDFDAERVDFGSYGAKLYEHDFDGMVMVYTHEHGFQDPWALLHSNDLAPFADAELLKWAGRARRETDRDTRIALYQLFNRRCHELQPISFLITAPTQALLHRRFEGAVLGFKGPYPELWWVEPENRIVGRPELEEIELTTDSGEILPATWLLQNPAAPTIVSLWSGPRSRDLDLAARAENIGFNLVCIDAPTTPSSPTSAAAAVNAAIDRIVAAGLDPTRIALIGTGDGAAPASWAARRLADQVRCVALRQPTAPGVLTGGWPGTPVLLLDAADPAAWRGTAIGPSVANRMDRELDDAAQAAEVVRFVRDRSADLRIPRFAAHDGSTTAVAREPGRRVGDRRFSATAVAVGDELTLGAKVRGEFRGTAKWTVGDRELTMRVDSSVETDRIAVDCPGDTGLTGTRGSDDEAVWVHVSLECEEWWPRDGTPLHLEFATDDGTRVRLPEAGAFRGYLHDGG